MVDVKKNIPIGNCFLIVILPLIDLALVSFMGFTAPSSLTEIGIRAAILAIPAIIFVKVIMNSIMYPRITNKLTIIICYLVIVFGMYLTMAAQYKH